MSRVSLVCGISHSRAVATLKTWRILFTDYRRPLKTFKSFHAAIGLYFFKESFA
jgi:hypothetical protein